MRVVRGGARGPYRPPVSDVAVTFSVLGGVVVLFVWNRLPVEVVAVGAALALYATGVLELEEALGGLGDTTVVFIATLFVVSEGLDSTGVTTWAGQQLIARVGSSRTRLVVLMMLLVAGLTALISVNGAVAALLPMVVVLAVRLRRAASQLLMPLAFAAHAGSLLALTGTPVNVIVSEAAAGQGGRFGFFDFALVGVPLLAGTIAIVVLFGETLLPHRTATTIPADLSQHARTLLQQYTIHDGVIRLRVRAGSPLVGRLPAEVDLAAHPDVDLVAIQPQGSNRPDPTTPIAGGDVVVVSGPRAALRTLAEAMDLVPRTEVPGLAPTEVDGGLAESLISREYGVAEVVIPPRSSAIGLRTFPGMVTSDGDLVVLAIGRGGQDVGPGGTELEVGDTLLLQGTWDALDLRMDTDPDVLVVDAPELVRRQTVPLGRGAGRAIAVLAAMVALLATGAVPAVVAGLLAAGALVLTRVVSVEQAYRSISWTTVILVGAMIALSTAMRTSGAAEQLATSLVDAVGDSGYYPLAIGLFLITAVLGQLISNMATALIVIPIALSAAAESGLSGRPLLMTVNVAAAASFLTPVATPVNLMVMGPAGYRFGDYWKLGLPLMALFFVVGVFLVPLIWSS